MRGMCGDFENENGFPFKTQNLSKLPTDEHFYSKWTFRSVRVRRVLGEGK